MDNEKQFEIEHLKHIIHEKKKMLLNLTWELEFAGDRHKDLLSMGAEQVARDALSKVREESKDLDKINEAGQKVEDIKDARRTVHRFNLSKSDLEVQIQFLESKLKLMEQE